MQEPSLAPGEVLAGKYRLVAPLGHGGMGVVWRADHLVLSSPVAIKLIHAAALQSEAARARFLREAQAAAALRSPHVLSILDFGFHGQTPFIVMELLEGETLAGRLARLGHLQPDEALRIITHVARAVDKAHAAGIVHRDLKPDNVFLVQNADELIAKVLDFGIAKVTDAQAAPGTETAAGSVLGSPHYMSPEQARGRPDVDHRSDLWSLGVIAFECMTGRRPFDGATLGDLVLKICAEPPPVPSSFGAVPPGFDGWFAKALQRDPSARFQSALELSESLRALVGGTVSLPPPSLGYSAAPAPISAASPQPLSVHSTQPAKKASLILPVVLALGALGILALTASLAFVFWPRDSANASAEDGKHSELGASAPPSAGSPGKIEGRGTAPADSGTQTPKSARAEAKAAQQQAAQAKTQAAAARAQAADARAKADAAKKKALESIGK